ncbi:MAG: hypothetical protein AB8B56_17530 [Crocinitomicaceae bacterium]
MIRSIRSANRLLFWVGGLFFALTLILLVLIPFNEVTVLGINSLYKPLKFSLSIWIYLWTIGLFTGWIHNKRLVHYFSFFTVLTMVYEQLVITVQAFRGTLSHFNEDTTFEMILFSLMGVFISLFTLYNLRLATSLKRQKDKLNPTLKTALINSIIVFVIASFIGGIMGAMNSHQIGGEMGEQGLAFVNWSRKYGDLRIAHFVGIHALQIIPLAAFAMIKMNWKNSKGIVNVLTLSYLAITIYLMVRALMAKPLFF